MAAPEPRRRRCATYTRKSSEEGLEQDFNSLDAQREACQAFIQSQKSEGWKLVPTHYDDGGYSGGNLDRPGLTKLLADIEAGKIDTVVVYKVDRLTRSLADFAKIVEILDAKGVTFVSVTQQFNTTTSMGRLTLNMLLSFAQFEREVTGERIRDKIAASKRKGLWMGGPVPLGYEAAGRTLEINSAEAKTVRTLFKLYLELGSVRRLQEEAARLGLRSKRREGKGKKMQGGRPLGRGYLYHLLSNPIYIGRIPHNGDSYEGQHPGIIDLETWEAVQKRLAEQAPAKSPTAGRVAPSVLRGKLFDEEGSPLTPSHTVKSGRRYRYYVSRADPNRTDANAQGQKARWRLPAGEIEKLVERIVRGLLEEPSEMARVARASGIAGRKVSVLLEGAKRWTGRPLDLIDRVEVSEASIGLEMDLSEIMGGEQVRMRHSVPAQIQRRGVERRIVLPGEGGGADTGRLDPALVKAVVRARVWFEEIASGRSESLAQIARAEGVSEQFVGKLMPLAFLSPTIVREVLAGSQLETLTAESLIQVRDWPTAWANQVSQLGLQVPRGAP